MTLSDVQQNWDRFGRQDPLWAILTTDDARGGRWDESAFFASGEVAVAELLALTDPPPTGRALDFGCGVGRLTLPLARHFREVVGVDIAPSMLALAERYKAERHTGAPGDLRYVLNQRPDLGQFESGSFDFVNAAIVLQHMRPAIALGYLREFARLLAPGGQLVFNLPSEPAPTFRGRLYRVLPRRVIYAYKRRRDGSVMEMNGIPIGRLVVELERAGLTVEKVRSNAGGGRNWLAFLYCCRR
ncbi:class I SAM-dependent methyltransferase [Modestobacter sp. NPDC049651]|uniref:class I SAM-dependent methyltransferase n=1 Tax=unclassified Modestobacter TaxID=2643866 RepID=UPI0033C9E29D